jgi:hypothetical protein
MKKATGEKWWSPEPDLILKDNYITTLSKYKYFAKAPNSLNRFNTGKMA